MRRVTRALGLAAALLVVNGSTGPARAQEAAGSTPVTQPIINGTTTNASDFPSVVPLSLAGEGLCTGTLIAPTFVLTAAHCFFDENNHRAVGDTDVSIVALNNTYTSAHVYIHPTYVSRSEACINNETDAAVVELSQPVNGVVPATMYRSAVPVGAELTLVGYGLEGSGEFGQEDDFPSAGKVNFGTTYADSVGPSYIEWIFRRNRPGSNTASGDSGGPAFYNDGTQTFLAGITCGGTGNAEFGTESFDTRVDVMASWVDSVAGTSAEPTPPAFIGPFAFSGSVGQSFSKQITVSGTSPITITTGALPAGLTFNGSTVSGTPTAAGVFDVTFSAENSEGTTQASVKFSIVNYVPIVDIRRVSLQFDHTPAARDFLFVNGTVAVGNSFRPKGKRVRIQIAQLIRSFRLSALGQGLTGADSFSLSGRITAGHFAKSPVRFRFRLQSTRLFETLATLGFPDTDHAAIDQVINLPISVKINGQENQETVPLTFKRSDFRWHYAE